MRPSLSTDARAPSLNEENRREICRMSAQCLSLRSCAWALSSPQSLGAVNNMCMSKGEGAGVAISFHSLIKKNRHA